MANPYPVALRDASGVERFGGSADFTDPANQPGNGGSMPGALAYADFLFSETAGAGIYTATLPLPAGTSIIDMAAYCLAGPWDADSAVLDVTDVVSGSTGAYFDSLDLLTRLSAPYTTPGQYPGGPGTDPTALTYLAFENNSNTVYTFGGIFGSQVLTDIPSPGASTCDTNNGQLYLADDTLTLKVTTTGAGGTTGRLLVRVLSTTPVAAIAAVKA